MGKISVKRKSAERFLVKIPTAGKKGRRGDIRRRLSSPLCLHYILAGEDVMFGAVAANL